MSPVPGLLPHDVPKTLPVAMGQEDDQPFYNRLARCWALEIGIAAGWFKKPSATQLPKIFRETDFVRLMGHLLPPDFYDEDGIFIDDISLKQQIDDQWIENYIRDALWENDLTNIPDDLPLFTNIKRLGALLSLTEVEMGVMLFAFMSRDHHDFREVLRDMFRDIPSRTVLKVIAVVTGHDVEEIGRVFQSDSVLAVSGIVELESRDGSLVEMLNFMSALREILPLPIESDEALVRQFLHPVSSGSLSLASFDHLRDDVDLLVRYLANAKKRGEKGINVLLYGPPGTGKTELVKALAQALGLDLYETTYTDAEGYPVNGIDRLRAYRLCQQMLIRSPNALLMLDEVEDIFDNRLVYRSERRYRDFKVNKSWLNRTLEMNTTPTIWITNDPDLDKAYLRRFDYSVKFPIPPQVVRMRIARHHLAPLGLSDVHLRQIAFNDKTSPAQYENAAKMARIAGGNSQELRVSIAEQALRSSNTLLGYLNSDQPCSPLSRCVNYSPDNINIDVNPDTLLALLKNKYSGAIAFYGPSGTGKTLFAHYLVENVFSEEIEISNRNGCSLLVYRSVDLCEDGENPEDKIAGILERARAEHCVLLFEDMDSAFSTGMNGDSIRAARLCRAVVRLLALYDGPVIFTLNSLTSLDPAIRCRLNVKVKFDYLSKNQRIALFQYEMQRLNANIESIKEWYDPMRRLDLLATGDFSLVASQFESLEIVPTAEEFYRQLCKEVEFRKNENNDEG